MGKFKSAVENVKRINRTQIAMLKVKQEGTEKLKKILESRIKENFIIKQVEAEKSKGGLKRK